MHSFQNFIVRPIPNHPPPLETRIWKLVVRALYIGSFQCDSNGFPLIRRVNAQPNVVGFHWVLRFPPTVSYRETQQFWFGFTGPQSLAYVVVIALLSCGSLYINYNKTKTK